MFDILTCIFYIFQPELSAHLHTLLTRHKPPPYATHAHIAHILTHTCPYAFLKNAIKSCADISLPTPPRTCRPSLPPPSSLPSRLCLTLSVQLSLSPFTYSRLLSVPCMHCLSRIRNTESKKTDSPSPMIKSPSSDPILAVDLNGPAFLLLHSPKARDRRLVCCFKAFSLFVFVIDKMLKEGGEFVYGRGGG